jgi:hypothetical protein
MMNNNSGKINSSPFQVVWGAALLIMGVAVFFRVPEVMGRVEEIPSLVGAMWFIKFSFYCMGAILVAGGAKKLSTQYRAFQAAAKGYGQGDEKPPEQGE